MLFENTDTKVESPTLDDRMKAHGYGNPQKGVDGHVTFTSRSNANNQMLVDVPGDEWHHMVKGVINKVGKLEGPSLEKYLN